MQNDIKLFDSNMESLNFDDCKININKNKLLISGKKIFDQRFDDISYVLYKNTIYETKDPLIKRNTLTYGIEKDEEHTDDFINLTFMTTDDKQITIESKNIVHRYKDEWFIFKSHECLIPGDYQIDITYEILNEIKRLSRRRNIKCLYTKNGFNYYLANTGKSYILGYSDLLRQLKDNNLDYLYSKFKNNFAYYINLALIVGYSTPGADVVFDVNRQYDLLVAFLTKIQGLFKEVYLIDNKITNKIINTKLNKYFSVFEKEPDDGINISSITSEEISNAMQLVITK